MTNSAQDLPKTNYLQDQTPDGRLIAPSATRNYPAIAAVVARYAPKTGNAFEIASGTGQHIANHAMAHPELHWHPSDLDPTRLPSIRAWAKFVGATNIADPIPFDAATNSFPFSPNLVVCVNVLHLIPETVAQSILQNTATALAPDAALLLFGPFKRDSGYASTADADFDANLRAQNPLVGYKSIQNIKDWTGPAGLVITDCIDMPANNLMWVFHAAR
jgi:hypothetical protein